MASAQLVCSLDFCKKKFFSMKTAIKHVKQHMRNHVTVTCPYSNCLRRYTKVSLFSAHLSRCHNTASCMPSDPSETGMPINLNEAPVDVSVSSNVEHTVHLDEARAAQSRSMEKELVLFYNFLQNKCLVPSNTVSDYVEHVKSLLLNLSVHMSEQFLVVLKRFNIEESVIANVMQDLQSNASILSSHFDGTLRSQHTRQVFFRRNFNFVAPIAFNLQSAEDPTETFTYQYVPILQSLKALFKNETVQQQFLNQITSQPDFYKDFKDGLLLKNNPLFNSQAKTIQILLYQDVFEVTNPLGSGKGKHKVLGVYYSLANFHPQNRSKIDPFQLVLLCNECHLRNTNQSVFEPLISDLKILENEGVDLGFTEHIRGGILCIMGDNLGSHWVGGFCTNFNGAYFCRYCNVTREGFLIDCCKLGVVRSKETYQSCMESKATNKINLDHGQGIKENSIFNQLSYYHVCAPGLPPCYAHDVFEGIIQHDMLLYVQYFVQYRWFSLSYLNYQIDHYVYSRQDMSSKPCTISKTAKRLPGKASQLRCFLKLSHYLYFPRL